MPRGNGRGPMGMGPQTGRAAGTCAGNSKPAVAAPADSTELGLGRGGKGRGCGGEGKGHGCGKGRFRGGLKSDSETK
jgi:Family of unknown function (DUF5320)